MPRTRKRLVMRQLKRENVATRTAAIGCPGRYSDRSKSLYASRPTQMALGAVQKQARQMIRTGSRPAILYRNQ